MDSWAVSFSIHVPTKKAKSLKHLGETANFGLYRCSEIEDIIVPYFNFSQSIKDSWLVTFYVHVPTKNVKSLTPLHRGDSNIWARWG